MMEEPLSMEGRRISTEKFAGVGTGVPACNHASHQSCGELRFSGVGAGAPTCRPAAREPRPVILRSLVVLALLLAVTGAAPAQTELENVLSPSRLPFLKKGKMIQISSFDSAGGNNDYRVIPAGGVLRLAEITGPGVITQIWITIASADQHYLRRIILRMYWDGETAPSVEVPVGDFFGTGFENRHHVTPFLGMSSGGFYSYFPMPFNRSARLEAVNETGQEIASFYYHIDYHALTQPLDTATAYFHASWRREIRTQKGQPYTLLEAEGEGHLVGINMSMQSYSRSLQYLEGDEEFFVDGEQLPSVRGTGTEDYFNGGWYFNKGEFAAPYHGLILKDDSLGRIAAYRFHVLDAVPFHRSLRAQIEHGAANSEAGDYSSTAYWYQKEPHRPFARMLPAGLRIPLRVQVPAGALEAEDLTPTGGSLSTGPEDMSAFGADWSNLRQLKVEGARDGDEVTLSLRAEEEAYDVDVYFTRGPSYGDYAAFAGGGSQGNIQGFEKDVVPAGKLTLRNVRARDGALPLRFVLKGKDARSSGRALGLDAFALRPVRSYVPDWLVIGPFPNPRGPALRRLGLDSVYAPEREMEPSRSYSGVNGQKVSWRRVKTPPSGRVDLYMFDPFELVVVYARTSVYSPREQTLPLFLGSDDGAKVFLNGQELHRFLEVRVAQPDQDTIALPLKKGWNDLLLKIENNFGGYNFFARIRDLRHELRYSAVRKETEGAGR